MCTPDESYMPLSSLNVKIIDSLHPYRHPQGSLNNTITKNLTALVNVDDSVQLGEQK